mmetsp:Transcript_139363/g.445698  ORF Transcript_139363/g.445698 Transcript_139363/m.445698 type:complete len:281 (-) Transcript_139363:832-1674(-)
MHFVPFKSQATHCPLLACTCCEKSRRWNFFVPPASTACLISSILSSCLQAASSETQSKNTSPNKLSGSYFAMDFAKTTDLQRSRSKVGTTIAGLCCMSGRQAGQSRMPNFSQFQPWPAGQCGKHSAYPPSFLKHWSPIVLQQRDWKQSCPVSEQPCAGKSPEARRHFAALGAAPSPGFPIPCCPSKHWPPLVPLQDQTSHQGVDLHSVSQVSALCTSPTANVFPFQMLPPTRTRLHVSSPAGPGVLAPSISHDQGVLSQSNGSKPGVQLALQAAHLSPFL